MKILLTIFIFSATLLFSGCFFDYPPPEPEEEWQVYENSRYYFDLIYPPNWTLGEAPGNNDGREFKSPDGKTVCRAYGFQNALTNENGKPQTLEEFITWLTNDTSMKVELSEDTTMAGLPAKELIYGQMGKVTRAVFVLGDESGRGLTCTYNNLKEEEMFRESFKMMKESFEIRAPLDS